MKTIGPILTLLSGVFILFSAPNALAGKRLQCFLAWHRDFWNPSGDGQKIKEQSIAKEVRGDTELAQRWLLREAALEHPDAGWHFSEPEKTAFIQSVPNWKSLDNRDLRTLTKVWEAIELWKFMHDPENGEMQDAFGERSFANAMRIKEVSAGDIDFWKRRLPDHPLPK